MLHLGCADGTEPFHHSQLGELLGASDGYEDRWVERIYEYMFISWHFREQKAKWTFNQQE
jgi:hypothetical protein